MTALFLRLLPIFCLFSAVPALTLSGGAQSQVVEVSRFSGKPVPRFESLRYSAVHGRQGPTLDQPILWRYERQGLPVMVVRETHGWRKVRDPDGDEAWVQARMLSQTRTVLVLKDAALQRKAEENSPARATLTAGVVADLLRCEAGWCEVEIERKSGWIPARFLWGVEAATGSV